MEHTATGANSIYHTIMNTWFNIPLPLLDTHGNTATTPTATTPTATTSADSGSSSDGSSSSSSTICHTHCAAIQDDFHWWHDINHENEESGKLLLVDHTSNIQSETEKKVIQVSITY